MRKKFLVGCKDTRRVDEILLALFWSFGLLTSGKKWLKMVISGKKWSGVLQSQVPDGTWQSRTSSPASKAQTGIAGCRKVMKDTAGKMLLGQYEAKVGEKSRIALPKKLREIIGSKLIVTLGYENSLIIVSEEGWKALLEGTEGRPFIEKPARETQRYLLGGATFVELDTKGRFIIPDYLRRFAKIKEEVVFLGLSRYVEAWDKEIWESYRLDLEKNIDKISEKLINKKEDTKNE